MRYHHRAYVCFVVLPQAVRNVVPPLNDFIGLQEDTALTGVIGVAEALRRAAACGRSATSTPTGCRAASSSGWPSCARWRCAPKLLLLDEITSALDPELVAEVLQIVRELADEG